MCLKRIDFIKDFINMKYFFPRKNIARGDYKESEVKNKPSFNNADYYLCSNCDEQIMEVKKLCPECQSDMRAVHSILLIDENHGIYIPHNFYKNFDLPKYKLDKKDYPELENPEHDKRD